MIYDNAKENKEDEEQISEEDQDSDDQENCSEVINLKIGMNVFGKNIEKPPKHRMPSAQPTTAGGSTPERG